MTTENIDATGTVQFLPTSPLNPDVLQVLSKDPSAAAITVTARSPVMPAGWNICLQIVSTKPATGQPGSSTAPWQFYRTIVTGDTPASISAAFAALVNATSLGFNVGAQYVTGQPWFAITHRFDDPLTVTAAAFTAPPPGGSYIAINNGGTFDFSGGSLQLDAGPILALGRLPVGWTPVAGSNVGQLYGAGGSVQNPAALSVQYGTLCFNILDPDLTTLRGELEFDTATPGGGIRKRMGVSYGLYMSDAAGQSLQDMGPGVINATGYCVSGVPIKVRADGTLYL